MEEEGLVLNLHGEVPSDRKDVTVMNAEASFLPTLQDLHKRFPKLRIVLGTCISQQNLHGISHTESWHPLSMQRLVSKRFLCPHDMGEKHYPGTD